MRTLLALAAAMLTAAACTPAQTEAARYQLVEPSTLSVEDAELDLALVVETIGEEVGGRLVVGGSELAQWHASGSELSVVVSTSRAATQLGVDPVAVDRLLEGLTDEAEVDLNSGPGTVTMQVDDEQQLLAIADRGDVGHLACVILVVARGPVDGCELAVHDSQVHVGRGGQQLVLDEVGTPPEAVTVPAPTGGTPVSDLARLLDAWDQASTVEALTFPPLRPHLADPDAAAGWLRDPTTAPDGAVVETLQDGTRRLTVGATVMCLDSQEGQVAAVC